VINVLLLVLGSVFEMYSAIVVLAPLLVPIAKRYEIDPIHFGVVFLANLELGFLFPPMGLNLFLSATRFNKPLPQLYKHALPFLAIMTVGVLIVTYLEPVTTGVLKLLHIAY
jgi:C4-dicarboxylate transporter DctM subunit